MSGIEGWVREILRCPTCHGELTDGDAELLCASCAVAYPIRDGIPVLLPTDTRPTTP